MNEINKHTESLWEGAAVIYDIWELATDFDLYSFDWVSRRHNTLADSISKLKGFNNDFMFWWHSLPESICILEVSD
ncbi:hypothetical protein REPUB_Repub09cG0095200 [Reevesia pubescens]